jgi:predicted peroxiredoxin
MRTIRDVLLVFAAFLALCAAAAAADPLFINLTAEVKDHRTEMALAFAQTALKRGHPVTVFLNDKAVLWVAKSNADGVKPRDTVAELIKGGATVIACGHCMKHYGVSDAELPSGVKTGSPDLTFGKLFAPGSRSMTW